MMKIAALVLFQFSFVAAKCQILPADIVKAMDSSRIISFCECVHGSDQMEKAQLSFVREIQKYYTIGTVFFESNNLYLEKSKIASELKLLDSTIKLIGYNPGYLYGSYQLIKKDLANSNPTLLREISNIFDKLDSNNAYYWYLLEQNEYDSLLQRLSSLQVGINDTICQNYINQLHYDLSYLKQRKM
ncbi:MAG: hypothetical protein K1X81_11505 [Bacteroidia bacterium]|nr:hypothetical protein [Bacteroidia bacterium]